MTDCGCEKARAELEEYLHDELCREDVADLLEHMSNCGDCENEHLVGVTLTEKVRQACRETAPADLREQVLRRIRDVHAV